MNPELLKSVEAFQAGDQSAFETIYRLQYNHIYYIAFQYAKKKEAAEDVVQDVFIEIFKSLHQLDTPQHFNAWMNRIVYHSFLRTIRNKQDTMRVHMAEEGFEEFIHDTEQYSPEEAYHHNQARQDVEAVFEEMTVDLQEVARMRFFDELSMKEIADVLEIPVGTVKSRINRVRSTVQNRLDMSNYTFRADASIAIAVFFKAAIEGAYTLTASDVAAGSAIASGAALIKPKKKFTKAKVATGAGFATLAVVPLFVQGLIPVRLEEFNYDRTWTSDNVQVALSLSSKKDHTKRMTANVSGLSVPIIFNQGSYTVIVPKNGDLVVKVDDEPILNQTVTNIDREAPVLTLTNQGDVMNVHILETESGIDWATVTLHDKEGVEINYSIEGNEITFDYIPFNSYLITGYDNAGNYFESNIDYTLI